MMVFNTALYFGLMNIGCGLLFILIALPLAARKVPRNALYGFRIQKAMASDDLWYAINAYGARQLIRWSLLLLGIGVLYFIFPVQTLQDETLNVILAVVPILLCAGVSVTKTVIYARQL